MAKVKLSLSVSYEKLLNEKGEDYFYRYVIGIAVISRTSITNVENSLLDTADGFFALSRQTGNINFFTIAKILRKAAHKLYRDSLRVPEAPKNKRFLQLVS